MQDQTDQPQKQRIFSRNTEMHAVDANRIDERAREIARTDGRSSKQVTQDDYRQAQRELQQERETGPVNTDMLETRARQLAVIAGRRPEEATRDDRDQAWRELHDQDVHVQDEPAAPAARATRDPAETPVRLTHQQPRRKAPDEAELPELETKEGVQEAEHDKQLAARRNEPEHPRG